MRSSRVQATLNPEPSLPPPPKPWSLTPPPCRALLQLEVCRVQALPGPMTDSQAVQPADWEMYIAEVAADILGEQSPRRLYQVRCRKCGGERAVQGVRCRKCVCVGGQYRG